MAGSDPLRPDKDETNIGDRPPGKGRLPEMGPALIRDAVI